MAPTPVLLHSPLASTSRRTRLLAALALPLPQPLRPTPLGALCNSPAALPASALCHLLQQLLPATAARPHRVTAPPSCPFFFLPFLFAVSADFCGFFSAAGLVRAALSASLSSFLRARSSRFASSA